MKKLLLICSFILVLYTAAFGQYTNITGTFQDPNGQVYANGTYTFTFVPTPNKPGPYTLNGVAFNVGPITGVLDNAGSFTLNGTIADNNQIAPAQSKWAVTICPNASTQCTSVNMTITGASMDISTTINAQIIAIAVKSSLVWTRAYQDTEVTPLQDGVSYYNTSLGIPRAWFQGTWVSLGGGSVSLLNKLDITPSSVNGGSSSVGTVFLTAAPTTNINVSLSSNSGSVTVPATVTVLAGNTSATFTVNTTVVGSTITATVTGFYGLYQTDTLQVVAAPAPIYGGVGSAGATSSVTLSGSTVILSTGDVLATLQTTPEVVGNQWSFNPSTQVIYLILFGGSHTFTDANTGFPFVFNTPISVTVGTTPMFLYQSTNVLVGNYKPKVAS